jgi:hypothetical protein
MNWVSQSCMQCRLDHFKGQKTTEETPVTPPETLTQIVDKDRSKIRERTATTSANARYREALKHTERLQAELDAALQLQQAPVERLSITPKHSSGQSEGTVVTPASDWHIEELVGAEVNGLNKFNPEIAEKRVKEFFQHSLRLVRLLEQDIKVPHWVLPLLGDFITNDIHGAESSEKNAMPPIEAILTAQNWIISGIDFLLNNSRQQFTIPCHSGNHARTTKTTHFSAENGHSLEYFMYANLAQRYASEPRVTFMLPTGIHSYLDIYERTLRFHHGHAVKYGGGVGGIYIPVNKAIAQWNKGRHADLDVFGHFHQDRDGGNFICNGSLIGYNGFAMSIKADFAQPSQTLFLEDKKRGRTCKWPILFTV